MGRKDIDLTGEKFGLWTVLRLSEIGTNGQRRWLVRCDCGKEKSVTTASLRSGNSTSCGCRKPPRTHGLAHRPEYLIWNAMRQRCTNPGQQGYARYGARGIRVAERWTDFAAFFADVGPRPSPAHTIERNDNDGHYEPGNVRWATRTEQARNRSSNLRLTFQGQTLCVAEWAEKIGVTQRMLIGRRLRGWTVERMLTEPARVRG